MKFKYSVIILILLLCLTACSTATENQGKNNLEAITSQVNDTFLENMASEDSEENNTDSEIQDDVFHTTENASEMGDREDTTNTQLQQNPKMEPTDEDFVRVTDYIPNIVVDLRYATDNNFTGQKIYDFTDVWLRLGTVKKLMLVQEELEQSDLYLKVWDGFRPTSAQFTLWEVYPDSTYVANPNNGFSSHSRGNTVDVTLVYKDGTEVLMPTGFDDFTERADRDYSDCGQEAAGNALLLEQVMKKHGFKPYSGEWWHFSDEQSYPIEETFKPQKVSWWYADCNEFISLRTEPSTAAEIIVRILVNEEFQVLAYDGDFALVDYKDYRGYVLKSYIAPM